MLLVHLEEPSPRARYVVRHVVERILGMPVRFAAGAEEFRSAHGPRLAYGHSVFLGAHLVPDSGALAGRRNAGAVTMVEGVPRIFDTAGGHDVFASIFFLLGLADETSCTERDVHGRVEPKALYVVRHDLTEQPWVDHWALELAAQLERTWPGISGQARRYRHVVTMDVDNVLRYAGRPLLRALGATMKELFRGERSAACERWRVRLSGHDPYMNALDVLERQTDHVDRAVLFLLLHGGGAFDHAVPPAYWPAHVHARYARLPAPMQLGLHPSYHTTTNVERWRKETMRINKLAGGPVVASRQHFLRWAPPASLRTVRELGFTEEHSLGFTDRAGFRASTCTPFPWYDLDREQETDLMLHPFAAMDSALIEHAHAAPAEVERVMCAFSDRVRAVGGTFITVWHDRFLSGHREFAPWPAVFQRILQHAKA